MIRIKRLKTPKSLEKAPLSGDLYNKRPVVDGLWQMQHGKCCYCEQSIPKKGHSKAVEHFKPKSIFKSLRNNWKNLLLACSQCNGKKSNKFPIILFEQPSEELIVVYIKQERQGRTLIIDPSDPEIDPENHIDFEFDDVDGILGLTKSKGNSREGLETIKAIGLKDSFYIRKHKNYCIKVLIPAYINLLQVEEARGYEFDVIKDRFGILLSEKSEFAGLGRAFARYKKLDRFGINI